MKLKHIFLPFSLMLLISFQSIAQEERPEDSLAVDTPVLPKNITEEKSFDQINRDYKPYNALAPAKAAFYSAILPGLGQVYNGRIWKVPLVYAGIGIPVYLYIEEDNKYQRYRRAYRERLRGESQQNSEFPSTNDEGLRNAQRTLQKNKELCLLFAIGFYALNIIDANVDAHLQQFNVNEDLSFKPSYKLDEFTGNSNYGFSLNYKF